MNSLFDFLAAIASQWFMSQPDVQGKVDNWIERWVFPLCVILGLGLLVVLAVIAFR